MSGPWFSFWMFWAGVIFGVAVGLLATWWRWHPITIH